MTAAPGSTPSGSSAKLPSASLTWKYSANTPSLKLENFQPASIPPECMGKPRWASREFQSGVMADTMTLSPGLKSLTKAPTSSTMPTASWPKIISLRSPMAPSQTVWTSDVQGLRAIGRTMASIGPQAGRSFSIQPTLSMLNMAKPFICTLLFAAAISIAACLIEAAVPNFGSFRGR